MPQIIEIPDYGKVEFPDDMSDAEISAAIQRNLKPKAAAPVPQKENSIGRQLGLTARHGMVGLAETVGIFSNPIAATMRQAGLGDTKNAGEFAEGVADRIGLPKPQNRNERIAGAGARMLAGSGGAIKAAGTTGGNFIAKALTSNPGTQASSAIGAGVSGSTAREMGAGGKTQFAASLAGGLLAPLGPQGAKSLIKSLKSLSTKPSQSQIDNAIKQAGINTDDLPNNVISSLRKDIEGALSADANVSPDALRRLADYKLVGAKPTGGSLTLNPSQITKERNLAKIGANTSDPAAQTLSDVANQNNTQLINQLNTLGAGGADDAVTAGGKIISSLESQDDAARATINQLYDKARATGGRSALIDPRAFTQKANDLLDDALLSGRVSADVRNKLNSIAKGDTPLTVDVAEQFKTNLGRLQRASSDSAERLALSKIRQALDDAPLLEGQGAEAVSAFQNARMANAAYMKKVESTPALKAVRDGIEPDKFVNTYIVGNGKNANIADLKSLKDVVKGDQTATKVIKEQIVSHLKNKALGGRADEVASLSPASYERALKQIGDQKLSMFFDKQELDLLKAVSRVAGYEKAQPVGSAVNNSNTASAVSGLLDYIANNSIMRKVPLAGNMIANDASNISTGIASRNALDASKNIRMSSVPAQKQPNIPVSVLLAPSLAVE